jgi:hypothetical protein
MYVRVLEDMDMEKVPFTTLQSWREPFAILTEKMESISDD